jgi:hypothetical protein
VRLSALVTPELAGSIRPGEWTNFSHGSDPAASPICRSAIPHRGVENHGPQALFSGTW